MKNKRWSSVSLDEPRESSSYITLNIPQFARLGLFSRSTERGFGVVHSHHGCSFSVRDATIPAMPTA